MSRVSFDPILIGSRRYGVNEDDSNYDYLLIVPESTMSDTLSIWGDADIIEYSNTPNLSTIYPVEVGYKIKGIANDDIAKVLNIPNGSLYDVILVPRPDKISNSTFILENINLYRMLCMDDTVSSISSEFIHRLKSIRSWAKGNSLYRGAYPDGLGYLIYTINTFKKGYSLDKSMRMLSTKCLYYHNEYKYKHISYVSDKAFRHMAHIIKNDRIVGAYQYRIITDRMEDVLRLSKRLLDDTKDVLYIENNGTIHSTRDISDSVEAWMNWMRHIDIVVDVAT